MSGRDDESCDITRHHAIGSGSGAGAGAEGRRESEAEAEDGRASEA